MILKNSQSEILKRSCTNPYIDVVASPDIPLKLNLVKKTSETTPLIQVSGTKDRSLSKKKQKVSDLNSMLINRKEHIRNRNSK